MRARSLELHRSIRRPSALALFVIAFAALALGLIAVDIGTVRRLVGETRWAAVVPALIATGVSYVAVCLSLVRLGRITGLQCVSTSALARVSFVSTALSNVFSIGGVSSYPVRTALLARQGEPAGPTLAMSLIESYLNAAAVACLLSIGLLYLALTQALSRLGTAAAIGAAALALAMVAVMTAGALSSGLRARLASSSIRVAQLVLGRRASPLVLTLEDLRHALDKATIAVRGRPRLVVAPVAFVVLNWTAALVAYWWCLTALNAHVGVGVLVTGFAVGVNAGLLSLVPGGLGVQEGSAAGTMALLGVPFGPAVLGAVLFRVVYHFVPFFVSLPFYWPLLRATPVHAESTPDPTEAPS